MTKKDAEAMKPQNLAELAPRIKALINFSNDWQTESEQVQDLANLLSGFPVDLPLIEEVYSSLAPLQTGIFLRRLAKLGYREVEPIALLLLTRATDGHERLNLAIALACLNHPKGFETLEELYRASLLSEDDPRTVPRYWITEDALKEMISSKESLALREKLFAINKRG